MLCFSPLLSKKKTKIESVIRLCPYQTAKDCLFAPRKEKCAHRSCDQHVINSVSQFTVNECSQRTYTKNRLCAETIFSLLHRTDHAMHLPRHIRVTCECSNL